MKPRGAATFPEKQSTLDSPSSNQAAAGAAGPPTDAHDSMDDMEPFLSIIGGIGCGIILITVVLLVTIRMRCGGSVGGGGGNGRDGLGSG